MRPAGAPPRSPGEETPSGEMTTGMPPPPTTTTQQRQQQLVLGVAAVPGGGGRRSGGKKAAAAQAAESRTFGMLWLVVACLTFPTLAFVSGAYRPPLAYLSGYFFPAGDARSIPRPRGEEKIPAVRAGSQEAAVYGLRVVPEDGKYLGGLLPKEGFDDGDDSCRSRFESAKFRRPSPHRPAPYLVESLRRYEALHRKCAPHTAAYNKTLPLLKWGGGGGGSNGTSATAAECRYLVWTPYNGLGNNILTMASAFLYSLLTGRVMLIDRGKDLDRLFCEPFPGATWLVPPDFPISGFSSVFNRRNNQSYGTLLRQRNVSYAAVDGAAATDLPTFVYAHLTHDYDDDDKRFFCEPDQAVLRNVPWMVLKSDNYFVPALFLNRLFEPELRRLFPEEEPVVFHHLSRYLFHPSNAAWGMITRYYDGYLAKAGERLGLQIRVFNHQESPLNLVEEQIVNCTVGEKLLPPSLDGAGRAEDDDDGRKKKKKPTTKAVLVVSLYAQFWDRLQNMYWERPAAGGAAIGVYQPSHEGGQRTGSEKHDLKVWTEMYLLSSADVLVTSAWSTFGYVAQGLAGIRPWILVRPYGGKAPEPSCVRDVSMEPCFHSPPWYDCRACKGFSDPGEQVPYVTHCRDVSGGIKLVDRTS